MSIWDLFLSSTDGLCPIGSHRWRSNNKVTRANANSLLRKLSRKNETERPQIVYADPPYTDDQYSRYYHLYDTLIRYNYPRTAGKARYPFHRFRSPFSVKTLVAAEFDELMRCCRDMDANLLISYPANGLLANSREVITSLLTKHYGRVAEVIQIAHHHSAMGASKGVGKAAVTEMLYYATCR